MVLLLFRKLRGSWLEGPILPPRVSHNDDQIWSQEGLFPLSQIGRDCGGFCLPP